MESITGDYVTREEDQGGDAVDGGAPVYDNFRFNFAQDFGAAASGNTDGVFVSQIRRGCFLRAEMRHARKRVQHLLDLLSWMEKMLIDSEQEISLYVSASKK